MFERFTDRAQKVMAMANQEARRFNHEYIGTEHVLLGLIKEGSGVGANVLKNLDLNLTKLRTEVEKLSKMGPDMVCAGKLPQTPRTKKVIEYAIEETRNLNHNCVGTEHILLGLLRETEGVAAQVLMNLGLKLDKVREEVLHLLGAGISGEYRSEARKNPANKWEDVASQTMNEILFLLVEFWFSNIKTVPRVEFLGEEINIPEELSVREFRTFFYQILPGLLEQLTGEKVEIVVPTTNSPDEFGGEGMEGLIRKSIANRIIATLQKV